MLTILSCADATTMKLISGTGGSGSASAAKAQPMSAQKLMAGVAA
jgi:hypothetical protein